MPTCCESYQHANVSDSAKPLCFSPCPIISDVIIRKELYGLSVTIVLQSSPLIINLAP